MDTQQSMVSLNLHDLYVLIGQLKKVKRTGWVLKKVGGSYPESVADHMYRMAIMALSIPLEGAVHADSNSNSVMSSSLKRDKLIRLALVHDVAECIVGRYQPIFSLIHLKFHWILAL